MTIDTTPVFGELQNISPSAIIELFRLTLDNALHGATTTYRFHAGNNLSGASNGFIKWNDELYEPIPVKAEGFAFKRGQLPRPKLVVSNLESRMSGVLDLVNTFNPGNDLTGATVTRIRTLAMFLDKENFVGNTNSTEDKDAEFPREIYTIDRKSIDSRDIVEFELAAVFDLAGIRAPKRQCTRALFPSIGTFNQ